jgi:hypothetical protein
MTAKGKIIPIFTHSPFTLTHKALTSELTCNDVVTCDIRDVLGNFPVSDIMLDVGKLIMAVHISLAYPVGLYPCTKSVQLLLTYMPFAYFKVTSTTARVRARVRECWLSRM